MLVRTLQTGNTLRIGDVASLSLCVGRRELMGSLIDGDLCVVVTLTINPGYCLPLCVGGAVIPLQAQQVFSVLPNSWFRLGSVGYKLFVTDKVGRPFAGGAVRCVIDAPPEVEIHQC